MGDYIKRAEKGIDWRRKKFKIIPDDYLRDGYFIDDKKNIRSKLLLEIAEDIADAIGYNNGISAAQLNRFYRHAKGIQTNIESIGVTPQNYTNMKCNILKLMTSASEAHGKKKIKDNFFIFIERNIAQLEDNDDPDYFIKGFMKHFEAVVAYYYYFYPKN